MIDTTPPPSSRPAILPVDRARWLQELLPEGNYTIAYILNDHALMKNGQSKTQVIKQAGDYRFVHFQVFKDGECDLEQFYRYARLRDRHILKMAQLQENCNT